MEQIAQLTYHTECVNVVSWNNSGSQLATAGQDKIIAVWSKDLKYEAQPPSDNQNDSAFGDQHHLKEKWLPTIKIRGPLEEICGIEWLHDSKSLIAATLDGKIEFYSLKNQKKIGELAINTQFIQGIAVDHTFNLLAIQTPTANTKIYKIVKQKKKYKSVQYVALSSYPHSVTELEQQKAYDLEYKEAKKQILENVNDSEKNNQKKMRKKRVPRNALFHGNSLITTSRKPSWSPDALLLCMVAGVSRDKSMDCVHVFHRSNLSKKVTTFLLPESSHASCARFNPKKLKLCDGDVVDNGSIVHRYGMKYRMLFAIICGQELFVFDTSKCNAVLYWKDHDCKGFYNMEWSHDGKALSVSDVEGFITRLTLADDDIVAFE